MAHIIRQTTVARDGHHNAFTDLQYWQGCYWVGYRKGAGHISMDGEVTVAVSTDRRRFREVAHLKMPGDCRDPKLLPLGDERMALFFPSWIGGHERRDLQHYVSYSDNGFDWEPPRPILDRNRWLWRVRPYNGRYYGLIQDIAGSWADGNEPHELDLAVSDDLETWTDIARIGEGLGLNESDIHFRPDGEAWVVARTIQQNDRVGSYFAAAQPPYTDWQLTPMHPVVHAPVFLEQEGRLYMAGRCVPLRDGETGFAFGHRRAGWSTAVWRVEREDFELLLRIPATGDCSYPGLIEAPDGTVCMSYYSQHAYDHGVVAPPVATGIGSVADVYFAELDLP